MKNVIIVDIDGTLTNLSHRLKFIQGCSKEQDWKKFYEGMANDKPNHDIINIVKILAAKYAIILVTGRPEKYRPQTIKWLTKHKISAPFLIMRPNGDFRPDHEVKGEIYEKQLKGKSNIIAVFEDRLRVVDMWRSKGLRCFQVDEWEERNWKKMCEHYMWQAGEYKKNYLETLKKCDEFAARVEKLEKKGKK